VRWKCRRVAAYATGPFEEVQDGHIVDVLRRAFWKRGVTRFLGAAEPRSDGSRFMCSTSAPRPHRPKVPQCARRAS
jgi:hypothetical protein